MAKKKVAKKKAASKKAVKAPENVHAALMAAITREVPSETYFGIVEGEDFIVCQGDGQAIRAEMVDGKPKVSVS